MNELASIILGPLAGPECRMALGRGWLILVRTLAALAVAGAVLVVVWWWWLGQLTDPLHSPTAELALGLVVIEAMLLAIAMILGPAVLAGSLAGDKERGALALLLTTRVDSREIVTGRLAGKLTQVFMILLACFPALVLIGALAGLDIRTLFVATLLPFAVAFGGGGLALVASTLSKRARDSLLAVYFVDLLFLLTPLARAFGLSRGQFRWFSAFNPFISIVDLFYHENINVSLISIFLWVVMGFVGIGLATWRLRPAALAPIDGERISRKGFRQLWVPAVQEDRPMIWKELFIERVGSLGKFGRLIGFFLIVALTAGPAALAAIALWNERRGDPDGWGLWARDELHEWIGASGFLLCSLIQWGIGLRAGVTISSERERGTWDSLMTSPLNGGEIIIGKVWGSIHALRWLILAAFFAWTVSAAMGAINVVEAVHLACRTLIAGGFMAAVGVRTSLACNTATRAMSVTIGIWLGSLIAFSALSGIIILTSLLAGNAGYILASQMGIVAPPTAIWAPIPGPIVWPLALLSVYFAATSATVADTRLRFDRLAGRITEGTMAIAVDRFFHGQVVSMEAAEAEMAMIHGEIPADSLMEAHENVG